MVHATSYCNIDEANITRLCRDSLQGEILHATGICIGHKQKITGSLQATQGKEVVGQWEGRCFPQVSPFTIILKRAVEDSEPSPLRLKIDPGSKKTGLAIVNDSSGELVFAAELEHRGQKIKADLESRNASRRGRRGRNLRYRQPRFLNRTKPKGWLAPSLKSRVYTIETWVRKFTSLSNIQAISQELVRFDMQQMENPEICGKEYQLRNASWVRDKRVSFRKME